MLSGSPAVNNAIGADDAIFIEKNQPAPYSGVLFSERKATEIRSDLLESDKTKIKLESSFEKISTLSQIIELKNDEIDLYRTQNQKLIQQENTNKSMQYIWFGLGILATGAAIYGAQGLRK